MLKSMTGYGRAVQENGNKRISAEIKAVNHRFYECTVRTPRGYSFLEEPIRSRVGERVKRGKIEIYVAIENLGDDPIEVSYNNVYLTGWLNSLKAIGKAHKLNDSVYHLMRGEIFDFEGKKFLAFGGARSHDIDDGILSWEDFDTQEEFKETVRKWRKQRKVFRINHISWWAEELPSDEEIQNAENNLAKVDYQVDYVVSHCAPQSIVSWLMGGYTQPDKLTMYFENLAQRLKFKNWFFGHYHDDRKIMGKFILLYDQIVRIQ